MYYLFTLAKRIIHRLFEVAEIRDGQIYCPCGHHETYPKWRTFFKCSECRRSFSDARGPM